MFHRSGKRRSSGCPKEYESLENGYTGTHKFPVDDFCRAVYHHKLPVLNAWTAVRYTIPGSVAIESCKQNGMPFGVPDCGDAPEEL